MNEGLFCPYCGTKSKPRDAYCVSCGAELNYNKNENRNLGHNNVQDNRKQDISRLKSSDPHQYAEFGERFYCQGRAWSFRAEI